MDGIAVSQMFAVCAGPDCLKEIIDKCGKRVKVYTAIKCELEKTLEKEVH